MPSQCWYTCTRALKDFHVGKLSVTFTSFLKDTPKKTLLELLTFFFHFIEFGAPFLTGFAPRSGRRDDSLWCGLLMPPALATKSYDSSDKIYDVQIRDMSMTIYYSEQDQTSWDIVTKITVLLEKDFSSDSLNWIGGIFIHICLHRSDSNLWATDLSDTRQFLIYLRPADASTPSLHIHA